jgi:hypothetical protein
LTKVDKKPWTLAGSNILPLPFSEGLTPTGYELPDDLSQENWAEVGRALGRVRGSVMWWVGDWWAYGEHRYGERKAVVDADGWDGPAYDTCVNAGTVSRRFEIPRRRGVLSFNSHAEVATLPEEWQDKLLDWAERDEHGKPRTIRAIRDEVKQTKAFLAQGWTPDQLDRKARAENGECVVANMREGADTALIAWADANDRFERVDRQTEWGNPFEMPGDGERDIVIAKFERFYFPQKDSLVTKTSGLSGKVLGCWCHPERCHGHIIAEAVNRETAGEDIWRIVDDFAEREG